MGSYLSQIHVQICIYVIYIYIYKLILINLLLFMCLYSLIYMSHDVLRQTRLQSFLGPSDWVAERAHIMTM